MRDRKEENIRNTSGRLDNIKKLLTIILIVVGIVAAVAICVSAVKFFNSLTADIGFIRDGIRSWFSRG